MQLCDCKIRLGGGPNIVLDKINVTPAEILVLQRIHAHDAVEDVRPTRMTKRAHIEERDRLLTIYKAKVIQEMFPGAAPSLPATLKDIGIDIEPSVEDDEEPRGKKAAKKARAARKAPPARNPGDAKPESAAEKLNIPVDEDDVDPEPTAEDLVG